MKKLLIPLVVSCVVGFFTFGAVEAADMTGTVDQSKVQVQPDGSKVFKAADNTEIQIKADGTKVIKNADGTIIEKRADGSKVITKPDGTRVELKPGEEMKNADKKIDVKIER